MKHRSTVVAAVTFLAGTLAWFAAAAPAQAMNFRLVRLQDARCGSQCPMMIAAEGEITPGTTARFVSFTQKALDKGHVSRLVLLDSPGGVVVESLALGLVLRELNVDVAVARAGRDGLTSGDCFSACVYALMGGRGRIAPAGSRLGVHRAFMGRPGQRLGPKNGPRPPAGLTGAMRRYARSMGVDPAVVSIAERTPSNTIHMFGRAEIARLKLAR